MNLPTLYKRDARGNINEWTIFVEGNAYFVKEGIVGGKITETTPYTCEAKNSGKTNATTAEVQAKREAQAEWEKKQKRGYTQDKSAVDSVTFVKPMKGDTWKDRAEEVTFPVWTQEKLDGIRFQSDKNRSYSTGGETFHTVPHIRAALQPIFDKFPDAFIDGELLDSRNKRGLAKLAGLVSVIHKPSDLTPELLAETEQFVQLHVFDGYNLHVPANASWQIRHSCISNYIKDLKSPYIKNVERKFVANVEDLMKELRANKASGSEGIMVRWGDCPFKSGRSKYLLKLKHFETDEFEIVDIEEGNGNWTGKAKRIILKLHKPATDGRTTTDSNIRGDEAWLEQLLKDKDKVIGQPATVEYQYMSEYGVPIIPYVVAIRNYE